jgi:hypothetical protein
MDFNQGRRLANNSVDSPVSSASQRHAGDLPSSTSQIPRTVTPIEPLFGEITNPRKRPTQIPAPQTPTRSTTHRRNRSLNSAALNANRSLDFRRDSFVKSSSGSEASDSYVFDKKPSQKPLPAVDDGGHFGTWDQSSPASRPSRLSFSELNEDTPHTAYDEVSGSE